MRFLKRMRNIRFSHLTIEQKISLLSIFLVLLTGGAAVVHSVTTSETERTNITEQEKANTAEQITEKESKGEDFPVIELEQAEKDSMIKESGQNENMKTSSDETAETGENDGQKESLIESQKTNEKSSLSHHGKKGEQENKGFLPSYKNEQEGARSSKNDRSTGNEEGQNNDVNNTNKLDQDDQPANDEQHISYKVPGTRDEPIDKEQPDKGEEPVDGEKPEDGEEPGNEPIDNQEPGEDSPGNENQENHDTLDEQNETIDHKVD